MSTMCTGMALPPFHAFTLGESGFDESGFDAALPFTFGDAADQFLERAWRDLDTVNYVTVEAWKCLRMARTKTKSVPQDLSLLPSMQLDIVLEIFGYLHPLELRQVSRTNKGFRDLLKSPVTDLTWRNSFPVEGHHECPADGMPECPSAISGRRWANLLFGPRVCEECGRSKAKPDFNLRRRVCGTCLEQNLINAVPGYSESHVMNSAVDRTTRVGDDYEGPWTERGRFWRNDGAALAAQYELCTAEGGPEAALRFIEERRILVTKNSELAVRCDDWNWEIQRESRISYSNRLDTVTDSVIKRLITEGFDKDDVASSRYYIYDCDVLYRMRRLTSKLYNRARPHILPRVLAAQTARLERQRASRILRRKQAISAIAYMALRTPVPGLQHAYYGPPGTIYSFLPIAQLVNEDSDESISPEDPRLAAALAKAPAFVDSWAEETQARLMSILPHTESPPHKPEFHVLDHATSVFRIGTVASGSAETVIGWNEARAHLDWGKEALEPGNSSEQFIEFNVRGSAAAGELAVLLGMDPEITTAAEMDAADARFVCGTCQPESQGRRVAMRWRDCVLHVGSSNATASHGVSSWLQLSSIAAADVRRRDKPDDYSFIRAWSCTLCNEYSRCFAVQKHVIDHIRRKHFIGNPAQGKHLIHFIGPEHPQRHRIMVFMAGPQPACYRCNHCADAVPHNVQLFSKRAIRTHMRDKHLAEFSNEDWTEVELLMPPT
ncbi:hypothetical protein K438DRAFT_1834429 [Mycena galopus ATCC 62051]|nr:hypothetical protein K438DRAFT_1834429 [Mycena galopus ATCC 62051]